MKCPVCYFENRYSFFSQYLKCSNCESYFINSPLSDTVGNNNYFNFIYPLLPFNIDPKKQTLVARYKEKFLKNTDQTEAECFQNFLNSLLKPNKSLLEIGFGEGNFLIWANSLGVDCYGVDISEEAVKKFRNKSSLPVSTKIPDRKFDILYCNALFEHVDDIHSFVATMSKKINDDGVFIIDSLPTLNEQFNMFPSWKDINFWKDCHRIIFSIKALEQLFNLHGYRIVNKVSFQDFNYRVLSFLRLLGFERVGIFRDPTVKELEELSLEYLAKACALGLRFSNKTSNTRLILQKIT